MDFEYKIIAKNKNFIFINLILLFVLDVFYFLNEGITILSFAIYFFYFLILLQISAQGVKQNIYIIALFSTFYFFLLGQKPILYLWEGYPFNQFNTFEKLLLDKDQYFLYANMIIISFLMIYYGYYCYFRNDVCQQDNNNTISISSQKLNLLRVIFVISLFCFLFVFFKKMRIYQQYGYLGTFTNVIEFNPIIKIFNKLYVLLFFILFSYTKSKKEKLALAVIIIITLGGLNMLLGNRSTFGALSIFLFSYVIFNKKKKVSSRSVILSFSFFIIMLLLFIFVQNSRTSGDLSGNIIRKIFGLFVSNGGSDSVIANTIDKVDQLDSAWKNVLYPIYFRLKGSFFKQHGQGIEFIEGGADFPHLISYLTNKELYLNGHGMGSSYIAEAFILGGIPGVIVINILFGKILFLIKNGDPSGFWSPLLNYIFYILIMLPRNSIFASFENCLIICVIIFLLKKSKKLEWRKNEKAVSL